jgi:hypothetical protein
MRLRLRRWMVLSSLAITASLALPGGQADPDGSAQREDIKLPSGKSQRDEILKLEHEQNIRDAAKLVELARQLQDALEKGDRFVLSIATIKKTDDIEKLARKIRSRMRHN